jgi:hypothetical protein
MIDYVTHSGTMNSTISHLSSDLANSDVGAIPASFDELYQIVEGLEGVRFRELFLRLAGPDADGDLVMQVVLRMAQKN